MTPGTAQSLARSRLQDVNATRLELSEDSVMIMCREDFDDHAELQLL